MAERNSKMNIALLGGDERHGRLGELLAGDGHCVSTFGIEKLGISRNVRTASSLKDALAKAETAVLPLPMSRDGVTLDTPFSNERILLDDILKESAPGILVLAGRVPESFAESAKEKGLLAVDYFAREELVIMNANATAEAALKIIMQERRETVLGTKILVIGFGRIGKILALKLKALGADVTVSARKKADFAWMNVLGIKTADTRALKDLESYSVIINTVPVKIFDGEKIKELNKAVFLLDLASPPGGIDMDAANKHGLKAEWALSLPGKAVPESAAAIIRDTIYHIIEELECSD